MVGGKYLDMLSVCDRISEMNKEFGVVRESVDAVLQLCESLGDDYAFVKEIDKKKEKQAEITQESLWEEYDHDEMLALARHLAAFRDSRWTAYPHSRIEKTRYSSLNEEFFTELPAIAATKCVSLLLQKEELSGEVGLSARHSTCRSRWNCSQPSSSSRSSHNRMRTFLHCSSASCPPPRITSCRTPRPPTSTPSSRRSWRCTDSSRPFSA